MEIQSQPAVLVFCALAAEARPLIEHWRLKKLENRHPFPIYANHKYAVVVTGLGKHAAAAAVAYTLCWFRDIEQPVMLNLGIAGHREHPVGSLFLANKLTDGETGRCFYPQSVFIAQMPASGLRTVGQPTSEYPGNDLFDMEASAFYEIACKFSSQEFIHCIKIVSDNRYTSTDTLNPQQVTDLIKAHLLAIELVLEKLAVERSSLPVSDMTGYQQLLGQFHFSASNAVKLKLLLQKWQLLIQGEPDWSNLEISNGKQLIAWLEERLAETVFSL